MVNINNNKNQLTLLFEAVSVTSTQTEVPDFFTINQNQKHRPPQQQQRSASNTNRWKCYQTERWAELKPPSRTFSQECGGADKAWSWVRSLKLSQRASQRWNCNLSMLSGYSSYSHCVSVFYIHSVSSSTKLKNVTFWSCLTLNSFMKAILNWFSHTTSGLRTEGTRKSSCVNARGILTAT